MYRANSQAPALLNTMSTVPARSRAIPANATLLVACLVLAGVASVVSRQDANWDLQNYHYYNPWAWLHGRIFGTDLAAAQLQTFHNPILDLPFYFMVAWDWPPPLVAFVLGLPTGVAAFLLILALRLLFADLAEAERRVAVACAFAIGITSAMGRATLGTTMNEWPIVALTLASVWLVVRALVQRRDSGVPRGALLLSGFLLGVATGGKLTAGTFAVALCAALVLRGPYSRPATYARFREAFIFGCAVLAGFVLAYGPWAYALWTHYGSPIFPYGNDWIRSPWWGATEAIGRRYGPHTFAAWLRFPFDLYSPKPFFVVEVEYRDIRMPLLYGMALVSGFVWLWVWLANRRHLPSPIHAGVSRAWRFVVAFFIVAFVLWAAQHSNYRYIVTLDLLAGALIVTLIQRNLRPGHAPAVAVAVAIAVVALTQPATWGRVRFGTEWFEVRGPGLEPDALVIAATDAPLAHVMPFLVPTPARIVGIDNSVVRATRENLLEGAVREAIRTHDGPIYALTDAGRDGIAALTARGLVKLPSTCAPVYTNMIDEPLAICRVIRMSHTSRPR